VDVDHFKALNDEHGHPAGDRVLASIAQVLRQAVRREDAVARYGGEEFAILLPNTSLEHAAHVAEKVRDAVARSIVDNDGEKISVTVSGGLAAIEPTDTVQSLIQRADAALYAAKASGRNRMCAHDGKPPLSRAGRLNDVIESAATNAHSTKTRVVAESLNVGTYLERDAISPELAQTCEELRRFVERRGDCQSAIAQRPS
jgi:diguanylate cyclase (GGDEF)-like protein